MKPRDPYHDDHDALWAGLMLLVAMFLAWLVWVLVSPMGNL